MKKYAKTFTAVALTAAIALSSLSAMAAEALDGVKAIAIKQEPIYLSFGDDYSYTGMDFTKGNIHINYPVLDIENDRVEKNVNAKIYNDYMRIASQYEVTGKNELYLTFANVTIVNNVISVVATGTYTMDRGHDTYICYGLNYGNRSSERLDAGDFFDDLDSLAATIVDPKSEVYDWNPMHAEYDDGAQADEYAEIWQAQIEYIRDMDPDELAEQLEKAGFSDEERTVPDMTTYMDLFYKGGNKPVGYMCAVVIDVPHAIGDFAVVGVPIYI